MPPELFLAEPALVVEALAIYRSPNSRRIAAQALLAWGRGAGLAGPDYLYWRSMLRELVARETRKQAHARATRRRRPPAMRPPAMPAPSAESAMPE